MDLFKEAADKMVLYHIRTSWFSIAKFYNDMTEKYGGSISSAFVLMALYEEEGVPVTRIAPRIGMEPNSLSRILKELERKRAIKRKRDKVDSRIVNISLTEKGKELRKSALKSVFHLEKLITREMTEEQLKDFFAVVEQVPTALEKFQEEMKG